MRIVRIFVGEKGNDGLWSVHLDGQEQNELLQFLKKIDGRRWLYDFFDKHAADLYGGFFRNMSVDDAVLRTMEELEEMEFTLFNYAEAGLYGYGYNLQHLFRPLNNFEYTINTLQKSKARIYNGWLRLYAIRVSENCYIITGGAIKLTHHMRRDHLQDELRKLEQTRTFLQNDGINFPEDLNIYCDE